MFAFQQRHSPLGRGVTLEELGGAGLFPVAISRPASPAKSTSSISGYNVIAMPQPDALKADAEGKTGG